MGKKIIDILLDYETLGGEEHNRHNSSVLELGAVAFEHDPESGHIPDFQEMIDNGFRVKFDIKSQKGVRDINKATIDWWKKQGDGARKVLLPSSIDVTVKEGHIQFIDWLGEQGLTRGSQIWCRGNTFDFPILYNCLHESGISHSILPGFWNMRETRTRIEAFLGRSVTECPLPKGSLPGFIMHNGIHDCAKDILMLTYAYRYAFGMDEIPTEDQVEPGSVKKFR